MSAVRIILERSGGRIDAAIAEDDRLIDYRSIETGSARRVTDHLLVARVTAVDRHLDGAFLDIGGSVPGFILNRDARHGRPGSGKGQATLQEGQRLLVQGMREAEGDKGPRLTAGITLKGRLLALQPHRDGISLSSRLKGRERATLEARAEGLLAGAGGLVLRRLAAGAADDLLRADALMLRQRWQELMALVESGAKPGAVPACLDPLEELVWQLLDLPVESLEAADDGLLVRLRRILELLPETLRPELVRLDAASGAFEQTGVIAEIERASARELPLEGGGRIIIERTAACTAIDVDGGGRAALDVDLEAAGEIGLQLRLRNIGGTIIVDFVDLPTKPQRQRLDEALRRAVRGDPLPVQIYPMSPLGIVQLSRARRGTSPLAERLRACPACGGSGTLGG